MSAGLAAISIILVLVLSAGDLGAIGPLILPTAIIASFVVLGGPDGSGEPTLWLAAFLGITFVTWTAVWFAVLSLVVLPLKRRLTADLR